MIITSRACVLARQDNAAWRACSPVQRRQCQVLLKRASRQVRHAATHRGEGVGWGVLLRSEPVDLVFQSADRDLQVLGLLFLGCDSLD
jgi:hypothetical protein